MTVTETSEALVPVEIATGVVPHVPEFATAMIPHTLGGLPYLADYIRLADAISKTEMVPQDLRGRPDAVVAVMMAGYEIGIGPMQALQSINLISGKPSLSAELMRALILQNGHQFIVDANNEAATVQCRRKDWPVDKWSTITYTINDARQAGLVEWFEIWQNTQSGKRYKQTWNPHGDSPKPEWVDTDRAERKRGDNYFSRPRSMLTARATSEAARNTFSDVLAGLSYTPDEILEFAPMPTGLSTPGEVAVTATPDPEEPEPPVPDPEAEEAMHQLAEMLATIKDPGTAETVKSHLRGKFGDPQLMDLEQIRAAIAVVAGWPETATPNDAPREGESF